MPFCRSAISFNFLKANLYFVLSGLLNFSGIIYYVGPRGGRQPWIFNIRVMEGMSIKSDQQPNEVLNK